MPEALQTIETSFFFKKIFRFLRRRLVLGIIFSLSLLYCLTSMFWPIGGSDPTLNEDYDIVPPLKGSNQPFQWHRNDHNDSVKTINCRNSIQGKVLVADDRGYICQRSGVLLNGCCDEKEANTKLYSCETCQENGCCSIYENCISCCMHPDRKALLQRILGQASDTFKLLFSSVSDHFELCLTKCRTSSQSVHHENSYRDPGAKHCYGESPPSVHAIPL